ncbi:hypothetical protein L1987_14936 [Smallanthus sonchifolius]|uniref:Uncharacterized protein n=1 Tax=Smallanthus sonchifolius TaxID=185202 RepID=A0ACB9J443_9ASTR|nr:hypothetical protein L1987_14936 [Smallanthus sonchifolius]
MFEMGNGNWRVSGNEEINNGENICFRKLKRIEFEFGNGEQPIEETNNEEPSKLEDMEKNDVNEGTKYREPRKEEWVMKKMVITSLKEDTVKSKGWESQSVDKGKDSYFSATAGVLRKGTSQQKNQRKK